MESNQLLCPLTEEEKTSSHQNNAMLGYFTLFDVARLEIG